MKNEKPDLGRDAILKLMNAVCVCVCLQALQLHSCYFLDRRDSVARCQVTHLGNCPLLSACLLKCKSLHAPNLSHYKR